MVDSDSPNSSDIDLGDNIKLGGTPFQGHSGRSAARSGSAMRGSWVTSETSADDLLQDLEILERLDTLLIKPNIPALELITGINDLEEFFILDKHGKLVFLGEEEFEPEGTWSCLGGAGKPFRMDLSRGSRRILQVHRPWQINMCCFPLFCLCCCLQSVTVTMGHGKNLGTIVRGYSPFATTFKVVTSAGDVIMNIEGPSCSFYEIGSKDPEFSIVNIVGLTIGKVSSKIKGISLVHQVEGYTYGITFPMALDIRVKGLLLGALILINHLFTSVVKAKPEFGVSAEKQSTDEAKKQKKKRKNRGAGEVPLETKIADEPLV